MRSRRWDAEAGAKRILTDLLGGTTQQRDPGGGPVQLHDFDLLHEDGRVIAVEVTEQRPRVQRDRWGDRQAGLVRSQPSQRLALRHGRRDQGQGDPCRAESLLAELEAAGIESEILYDPLEDGPALAARQALYDLGVRLVYHLGEPVEGDAVIDIGDSARFGSLGASDMAEVATVEANEKDNLTKLTAAADADERHLFVWVESSNHHTTAAMDMFRDEPDRVNAHRPDLPAVVDRVWLATGCVPPRLWSFTSPDGWTHHGTVGGPDEDPDT